MTSPYQIAAAEPAEGGQSASYYPISVEEYTYGDFDELRINKTYQLSLSDDPRLIPRSIEDKGKTLTLGDVKWSESMDVDGDEKHDPDPGQTENPSGTETPDAVKEPVDLSGLKRPVMIGVVVLVLAGGGVFAFKKFKERR